MAARLQIFLSCTSRFFFFVFFFYLHLSVLISALHFNYPSFQKTDGFILQAPSNPFYNRSKPVLRQGAYWLTPDPRHSHPDKENQTEGRVLYKSPLQFKGSDGSEKMSSFRTSFSFQIITPGDYGDCGDGLAFFMAASEEVPIGSTGQYLGIANGSVAASSKRHLFAVEFDTYENPTLNDPSSSHVGIDINSLISHAVTDTSDFQTELFLYSNYTFTSWVEYNASSHLINVWATNSNNGTSTQRPLSPTVSTKYDLSSIFLKDMYVGFSASSGDAYEGHVLYSWEFHMDDVN